MFVNVERIVFCQRCEDVFTSVGNATKYCPKCRKEMQRIYTLRQSRRRAIARIGQISGYFKIIGYQAANSCLEDEDFALTMIGRTLNAIAIQDFLVSGCFPDGMTLEQVKKGGGGKRFITAKCTLIELGQ